MVVFLEEGDDEGDDKTPTSEEGEMRGSNRRRGKKKKAAHLRVVEPETLFSKVRNDEFGKDTEAVRHGGPDGFYYGGFYEDFDS